MVFLWTVIFKQDIINKSKKRVLTSSEIFSDWYKKIHKRNLISEIDQIDLDSVIEVESRFENNGEDTESTVHNIEKLEKDQKRRRLAERILPEEKINLDADPEVSFPEELSPSSSSNLEMVFN